MLTQFSGGDTNAIKLPARAATTGALAANTATTTTLTANANGAIAAQDGITLILNDRLLVKNEATGANNGIYYVSQVGTGSTPFILTRTVDFDNSTEVIAGTLVVITEGTTLADTIWELSTNNPITIGVTALTFIKVSGAIDGSGTTNEITYWVDSDTVGSLAVATYPSLTELSYVKGVSSAIQTQFTGKANTTLNNLGTTSINASLLVDTDSAYDLGSTTKALANIYVDTVKSITGNPLALTPIAGQNLNVNLSTTGDFTVNTNQLYVDTSATAIGLNTSSPASLLHINGVARFGFASTTNASLVLHNSTNANTVTINSGVTSASYSLTLPLAVSAAGGVLTDVSGNGVMSWVVPSTSLTVSTTTANATWYPVSVSSTTGLLSPTTSTSMQLNTGLNTTAFSLNNGTSGSAYNLNPLIGDPVHLLDFINDGTSSEYMARFSTYGILAGENNIHFFRARGTAASPTATQSGDDFFSFGCRGYGATAVSQSTTAFQCKAEQNWTDAAQGSAFYWGTTTNGTAARHQSMKLTDAGSLIVGTSTSLIGSERILVSETTTGGVAAVFKNASTGTGATTYLDLRNSTSSSTHYITSTGYTTDGSFVANRAIWYSTCSNGMAIVADNATGTINFYTGGYGTGNLAATITAGKSLQINATQTSVNNSTGGTTKFSQPESGSTYKVVMISCASALGTASYTYPVAFTTTPSVVATNDAAAGVITSLSTTAVTLTGATTTGNLMLIGY